MVVLRRGGRGWSRWGVAGGVGGGGGGWGRVVLEEKCNVLTFHRIIKCTTHNF